MLDIDPFTEEVLHGAMEMARAWDVVNDSEKSGMFDSEAYYEMCLQAGYSEEASQKAANRRANARMDQGLKA